MDNTLVRQNSLFSRFSKWVARRAGHAVSFALALLVILVWAVTGPMFGFSDTWQLVINTGTTIVTFLMVFLIQNSQTRDSEAIHIKLDELIESTKGARRDLLDLEEMPEEELHRLQTQFEAMAAEARRRHHHARNGGNGRRRSGRPRRPTPFEGDEGGGKVTASKAPAKKRPRTPGSTSTILRRRPAAPARRR